MQNEILIMDIGPDEHLLSSIDLLINSISDSVSLDGLSSLGSLE